uniref:Uncharacterized protein n=1 Tax=Oryza barthii TaxID=65489 RepID=A0A0D3FKL7_9ORYZ
MATPVGAVFLLEGIVTLLFPFLRTLPYIVCGLFIGNRSCSSELGNDDLCFILLLCRCKFLVCSPCGFSPVFYFEPCLCEGFGARFSLKN